ncbi:MAG: hypothetical protein RIT02_3798, partial [Planctomycetota bacterium]
MSSVSRACVRMVLVIVCGCGCLCAESQGFQAERQWPQFRGPGARGLSVSGPVPEVWSATENVEWKRDVAGRGWSSPVVWGESVFLTTVVNT